MKTLIYLAVPYTHENAAVREFRFQEVTRVAGELMMAGRLVYSPITHSHPIAKKRGLPTDWEYWEAFDRAMLKECGQLMVLMMPGWEESKGVAGEIAIAKELGIAIEYIEWTGTAPVEPDGKRRLRVVVCELDTMRCVGQIKLDAVTTWEGNEALMRSTLAAATEALRG